MKRIVLARPQGPRNVGMIVRIAANFAPCELVVVSPLKPSMLVHPDFEQMSHGVPKAKDRVRIVTTMKEALADCTASVGFTARAHDHRSRRDWRSAQTELVELANDADHRLALVFGNEETGLTREETELCGELVHIATSAEHGSLNLAVASGIVLSALYTERSARGAERGSKPITGEAREFLKAALKHAFGERVALTAAAKQDIIDSIERVYSRAPLEDRDARAWHLMARALGSTVTPKDLGLDVSRRRGRRLDALSQALQPPEGTDRIQTRPTNEP